MLLTTKEAKKCKVDALRTCVSLSAIYVTGNHMLCVLELFKRDEDGIKKNSQA